MYVTISQGTDSVIDSFGRGYVQRCLTQKRSSGAALSISRSEQPSARVRGREHPSTSHEDDTNEGDRPSDADFCLPSVPSKVVCCETLTTFLQLSLEGLRYGPVRCGPMYVC